MQLVPGFSVPQVVFGMLTSALSVEAEFHDQSMLPVLVICTSLLRKDFNGTLPKSRRPDSG